MTQSEINKRFIEAINEGNLVRTQILFEIGKPVLYKCSFYHQTDVLFIASNKGFVDIVEYLLEQNLELNITKAFLCACQNGNDKIAQLLYDAQNKTTTTTTTEDVLLFSSWSNYYSEWNFCDTLLTTCKKGYINIILLLLTTGKCQIDEKFVLTACEYGHIEIVKLSLKLFKKKSRPFEKTNGDTKEDQNEIAPQSTSRKVNKKFSVNITQNNFDQKKFDQKKFEFKSPPTSLRYFPYWSSQHIAVEKDNLELFKYLFLQDFLLSRYDTQCLFNYACKQNSIKIVSYFLSFIGREIKTTSNVPKLKFDGDACFKSFQIACLNNSVDVIDLFTKIALFNSSRNILTMFDLTCQNGHVEAVGKFLKDKNFDFAQSRGLENACKRGYYKIVKELLEDGRFDPSVSNQSPIRFASGFYDIVKLLLSYSSVYKPILKSLNDSEYLSNENERDLLKNISEKEAKRNKILSEFLIDDLCPIVADYCIDLID
jgi:ankyrin repeat protein